MAADYLLQTDGTSKITLNDAGPGFLILASSTEDGQVFVPRTPLYAKLSHMRRAARRKCFWLLPIIGELIRGIHIFGR